MGFYVLYGFLWPLMAKYRFVWTWIVFSRGLRSKFIWSCSISSTIKKFHIAQSDLNTIFIILSKTSLHYKIVHIFSQHALQFISSWEAKICICGGKGHIFNLYNMFPCKACFLRNLWENGKYLQLVVLGQNMKEGGLLVFLHSYWLRANICTIYRKIRKKKNYPKRE